MSQPGKYTQFDASPHSTHSLVVSLIPPGARVLEFGCATGFMSEVLTTRLGCRVTGIEYSAEAGELARRHCERVFIGDAETLDFKQLLGDERFDILLFADVLEHLREPDALLRRVSPLLTEQGAIVASIPNIAHGSLRLALLHGEFRYRDKGLLDNTHLRFFTRESVQDLFEDTGHVITHWLRKHMAINRTEITLPDWPIPEAVQELLAADPEATTYQFIVRAVPSPEAAALKQARAQATAATAQNEWLSKVSQAAQEIAALVPAGGKLILVDEDQFGGSFATGREAIPFLEHEGSYWGPPPDDATAVQEFERLRQSGAEFLAIAWPAFWWLDQYPEWQRHLRSSFPCMLENDLVLVFDIRARL